MSDEKEAYRQIGQNIKTLRQRAGMTQDDMAKLLGVTFQQVQKYETGKNRIPALSILMLQQALGTSLSGFFEHVRTGISPPSPKHALIQKITLINDRQTLHRLHRVVEVLLEED